VDSIFIFAGPVIVAKSIAVKIVGEKGIKKGKGKQKNATGIP
jgi:hypothetical protein